MRDPDHIVRFKTMVAAILGTLYGDHPNERWDEAEGFFEVNPAGFDADLFDETVNYLVENGYLTRSNPGYLRLNDKSFFVLQKPNPLKKEESLGSTMARWATDALSGSAKAKLSTVVDAAMGAIYDGIKLG